MKALELFAGKPEPVLNREIRVLGIDLGTTNSTVAESACGADGTVACRTLELEQPTTEGTYTSPLVPSVVAILPDGNHWVGEGAKRLRANPHQAGLLFERNLFYDTKNEMGLRKTYFRAPESFNHASKIAGTILSFLKEQAEQGAGNSHRRISVTVPASFQLNQRRDTLLACRYAGLALHDEDLLDEPTAALIDYLYSIGTEKTAEPGRPSLAVVFDFGGGTCDVSVLEITVDGTHERLSLSQLAVSRYHRLGGGDIDAAIVHECLIPQLADENGLLPFDVTWVDKKKGIEPQLLGTAEALKIALCRETDRLIKFNRYDDADKNKLAAQQPFVACMLKNRELRLSAPSLSAAAFESLLEPFLDTDFLFARETEFRLTQSIFAPLQDALHRAGKKPQEVNFCLMVGGSSLIPQVIKAVKGYFPNGAVDCFPDALSMQTAVAGGAALNALFQEIASRPLIVPVLYDGIDLIATSGDPHTLIPARSTLPFPEDGSCQKLDLVVPSGPDLFVDKLRFEIVGHADRQLIFNEIWTLPGNGLAGEEITMEFWITAGKQFECRAYLSAVPGQPFERSVGNPLVNTVNPGRVRLQIEEAEEELRKKKGGSAEDRDAFVQLAQWYADVNQHEKALDYLRTALNLIKMPDVEILVLQGIYHGELGDHAREEKAYREADRVSSCGTAMFNLALSFSKRGLNREALATVEGALKKADGRAPYLTLKAKCLENLERSDESKETIRQALASYDPPQVLSEWELGWYRMAAKLSHDEKLVDKADEEWNRRRNKKTETPSDDVLRPDIPGTMSLREES